jgi:predicted Zn-dependent protease
MLKLSKQEEKELGAEIHQQLQGEGLEIIADPKLDSLIAKLVAPIFSEQLNTDQEYRFYVVNDMEVNAFACVGGNIYVNRGLIEFVDNEAQLQFVLGHEIGHIELGHSSRRFTFLVRGSQVGGELLSQLTGLVYQAVSLGYAENQELASDRFGYEHMTLDKQQVFSFLSRSHESQYGESISIDSPDKSGVVVRAIEGHFASHPTAEQRIRNLEALNQ